MLSPPPRYSPGGLKIFERGGNFGNRWEREGEEVKPSHGRGVERLFLLGVQVQDKTRPGCLLVKLHGKRKRRVMVWNPP